MMQFLAVAVFTSKREQPDIYESKRTTEKTNLIAKKVNILWTAEKAVCTFEKLLYSFFAEMLCSAHEFCIDPIILGLL